MVSDSVKCMPISRWWRYLLAWTAALLLHALLLGTLIIWQPIPQTHIATHHDLDVLLVSQPEQEFSTIEPITEIDQPAPVAEPIDNRIDRVDETKPPVEPRPQPNPNPETAAKAGTKREANSEANSEAAHPPSSVEELSGSALLAQATASVRQQGFDAPPVDNGGEDQAQQAAEARYIAAWTRRVEEYGNRHYPAPSQLDGQLRVRVVIGREGQLLQAEVIQSSGHPELDQAALQALQGAAPYRPFDRGMGAQDSLTVIRNWRFGKGHNFGVR